MSQQKVLQLKQGHKYFKVNQEEMIRNLRGMAVCDSCSVVNMEYGYLIPVLNSVYCEVCFDEWKSRAVYYEEDREYEDTKVTSFSMALFE